MNYLDKSALKVLHNFVLQYLNAIENFTVHLYIIIEIIFYSSSELKNKTNSIVLV